MILMTPLAALNPNSANSQCWQILHTRDVTSALSSPGGILRKPIVSTHHGFEGKRLGLQMIRAIKSLSDWPFRLKLIVGPTLALTALALLAWFGMVGLSEQLRIVGHVADSQAATRMLTQASQGIQEINGRLYRVLSQQAAHTEGLNAAADLEALKARVDAVTQVLISYRDLYAGPNKAAAVNDLITDVKKYEGALDWVGQMLDLDFSSAVSFLAPFDANYESLKSRLAQLATETAERAAADVAQASDAAARGRQLFIGLTAGVMLIVVTVSLVIGEATVRSIKRIASATLDLAEGKTDVAVESLQRRDELGAIVRSLDVFKSNQRRLGVMQAEQSRAEQSATEERTIAAVAQAEAQRKAQAVVTALAAGLSKLAEGDLTGRLLEAFGDEYEQLRTDFNAAADSLERAMCTISDATGALHASADEIAAASDDMSRRSENQAASLEETAAALAQITNAVKNSASSAQEAANRVTETRVGAEASREVVEQAVVAMQRIKEFSSQISNIVGLIDSIAFQTSLLALNAGIEAARAGDAGRGFAVVAMEVRGLAQRSSAAAKEITDLISSSSQAVGCGVNLVTQTGEGLVGIVSQVGAIDALVRQISASAGEQATGLSAVSQATTQMDQVVQQNAAMVHEATAAAHALKSEVGKLNGQVGQFKIKGQGLPTAARAQTAQRRVSTDQRPTVGASANRPRKTALAVVSKVESWEEF
jgi:methyl-accepting chemotaxis protein